MSFQANQRLKTSFRAGLICTCIGMVSGVIITPYQLVLCAIGIPFGIFIVYSTLLEIANTSHMDHLEDDLEKTKRAYQDRLR